MRFGRFRSLLVFSAMAAMAALATAAIYVADDQRLEVHLTASALNSARQIAAQAEGMALAARERGEEDPVGWATSVLAQGIEPRAYQIAKFTHNVPGGESFTLDRASGVFDYVKVFAPEEGSGVRIQLATGYHGFLGTRTRGTNDFAALALYGLILFVLAGGRYIFGHPGAKRVRAAVDRWLQDAKTALLQLGMNIREMVREAQRLAVAAGKSRGTVGSLRERIHGQVTRVHESRALLKDAEQAAAQAEGIALSLVIEASRLGNEGKPLKDKAEELHRLVLKLRGLSQKSEDAVRNLEIELEPWATDADVAFHSYDDVFRASQEMQVHIRRTTESMLGQSRLLKELAEEARTGVTTQVKPAEPAKKAAVRGEIQIDDVAPQAKVSTFPTGAPAEPTPKKGRRIKASRKSPKNANGAPGNAA